MIIRIQLDKTEQKTGDIDCLLAIVEEFSIKLAIRMQTKADISFSLHAFLSISSLAPIQSASTISIFSQTYACNCNNVSVEI